MSATSQAPPRKASLGFTLAGCAAADLVLGSLLVLPVILLINLTGQLASGHESWSTHTGTARAQHGSLPLFVMVCAALVLLAAVFVVVTTRASRRVPVRRWVFWIASVVVLVVPFVIATLWSQFASVLGL